MDGAILGRLNLRDIANGSAVLGYRVAENVAGHGVATTTVDQLCREAATTKAGFVLVGPADPADLGGKPGSWYERQFVPPPFPQGR